MASFTRKAIMDSCIRLLEERSVDRITVKDIVEDCGINRNTFYYHFEDLPSLIMEIIREDADRIMHDDTQPDSFRACMENAISFVLRRRSVALHLYRSSNRDVFMRYLLQICRHVVSRYVDKACGDLPVPESDRRLIIQSYACECFGGVISWLDDGLREDLTADLMRMCDLREGATRMMIQRSLEG